MTDPYRLGDNTGPLKGLTILDLTAIVMGPYATQILADLGADVIKVEPPAGDNLRAVGPMREQGMGHLTLHLNRNKRSIILDLKQPEGLAACLKLAATVDVLIYNVRPQAMQRLGLSYEAVSAVNPKLVYVGAYGYSEAGPYAGRPAYDDLIQGVAGVPALMAQQTGGEPRYAPVTLADRSVGLQAAIAVLAAVTHARATGQGQSVEVSMFESLSQLVLGDHLGGASFIPAIGETGYARLLAPDRKPYKTADGYLSVLIYNDKHWQAFFKVIKQPELSQDPRFATHQARAEHIREVYAHVAQLMLSRSTDDWFVALEAADIPVARLNTPDDLLNDPHLNAVGFFQTYTHPTQGPLRTLAPVGRYSRTPTSVYRATPEAGADSAAVLAGLGYSEGEIAQLLAKGVTA
jgi:crotonobetainyl-CoA:carnitine CoA-transferase CaiB-like acyl-CoA transferase